MGRKKGSQNKTKESEAIMVEERGIAVIEEPTQQLENLESELDRVRSELEAAKVQLEEKKNEIKIVGSREHDSQEIEISKKMVATRNENASKSSIIEKQRIYDSQLVTGKFINRRAPGQMAKLTYCKYATDVPKWWPFKDGGVYTIPRGFADQIREYYHTPKFVQKEGAMDPNQAESQIHSVDNSQKKYDFVPLDW